MAIPGDARQRLADYLSTHHLRAGLGTEEETCTVAAINLALTGYLTDEIPPCMSAVIGRWIIGVQDAMPDAVRNSASWKGLLPEAAGTGRDREPQRLAVILEWMWDVILPQLSPLADRHGFGSEWRAMLTARDVAASDAVAWSADAPTAAAIAARAASDAAAWSAAAVSSVESAGAGAARAASAAVHSAIASAGVGAADGFWVRADPAGLLHAMIAI